MREFIDFSGIEGTLYHVLELLICANVTLLGILKNWTPADAAIAGLLVAVGFAFLSQHFKPLRNASLTVLWMFTALLSAVMLSLIGIAENWFGFGGICCQNSTQPLMEGGRVAVTQK